MKTFDLTGKALDYAVAKAQGFDVYKDEMLNGHTMPGFWVSGYYPGDLNSWVQLEHFTPSTSWMKGGPIIEREGIGHDRVPTMAHTPKEFCAWMYRDAEATKRTARSYGPTPLVAAMRCLVASRLGDEVEIPKELL